MKYTDDERQKVIEGMKRHSEEDIPAPCANCPYDDGEPYCSQRLAKEALYLLQEQEPIVLPLDEVLELAEIPVWVEHNTQQGTYGEWSVYGGEWKQSPKDGIRIYGPSGGVMSKRYYGKTWRCWTSRPTAEQTREKPWA